MRMNSYEFERETSEEENNEDLSDEDFQMSSVDKPSSSNSQGMRYDKGENPMKSDDVETGMWVMVGLRKSQDKKAGQFNVLCLEKPFGINVPQNFEKGGNCPKNAK